jgi:hypothetical protein
MPFHLSLLSVHPSLLFHFDHFFYPAYLSTYTMTRLESGRRT